MHLYGHLYTERNFEGFKPFKYVPKKVHRNTGKNVQTSMLINLTRSDQPNDMFLTTTNDMFLTTTNHSEWSIRVTMTHDDYSL